MSVATFEKQGNTLVCSPEGKLDSVTSPVLERELQPWLETEQDIEMNFSKVEYISSAGLRVLLAADQVIEDRDGTFKVTHANQRVMDIFTLVGFTDAVNVVTD